MGERGRGVEIAANGLFERRRLARRDAGELLRYLRDEQRLRGEVELKVDALEIEMADRDEEARVALEGRASGDGGVARACVNS